MFSDVTGLSDLAKSRLRVALNLTFTKKVDPEHLLLAMLDDEEAPLVRVGRRLRPDLNAASLKETLILALQASIPAPAPPAWSDALLSPRFQQMLSNVQADPAWTAADASFRDHLLTAAALHAAPPRIRSVFAHSGVDPDQLEQRLRKPPAVRDETVAVFDPSGGVNLRAFSRPAQTVLRLIETEGRGLGLKRVGTPLFLFALLSRQGGLLENALRVQAPVVDPKKVQGNLLLHLKALGQSRFNDALQLNRAQMQTAVVAALEAAEREAAEAESPLIGEPELTKAFLRTGDPFVDAFLRNEKVDVTELSRFVTQRRSGEEAEEPEENRLANITEVERRLRERVVGQDHVVDAIMPIIKRLRFGYVRRARPAGVLLFLGMSGTGKTQLAKEIARAVYGSEEQLIFLEMGQFGTEHSKTMFVGAPPGLVGYGEGLLTNGLRDKPEAVVLFDEVEKAHKSVFDVVLRFLDEGQISDPAGPVRDGTRCIIILTSNHALDVLQPIIEQQTTAGQVAPAERDQIRATVRRAILQTEFFRPEFINRVDDVLLFNTFTESAYRRILRYLLDSERESFRQRDYEFTVDDGLLEHLVRICVGRRDEGARVCGRLVSDLVVTPLIDFFVDERHEGIRAVELQLSAAQEIEIRPPAGTR